MSIWPQAAKNDQNSLNARRAKLERAAGLGVHRRRLGVGGGGAEEDEAGDDEDDRRQAEREARDQAQRVVDRRADVPVGGREEGVDAQDPLEALEPAFGHVLPSLGRGEHPPGLYAAIGTG